MTARKNAFRLAASLTAAGIVSSLPIPGMAQEFRHGEIRAGDVLMAWDETVGDWVTPEQFWLNYADSRGGLTGAGAGTTRPTTRSGKATCLWWRSTQAPA